MNKLWIKRDILKKINKNNNKTQIINKKKIKLIINNINKFKLNIPITKIHKKGGFVIILRYFSNTCNSQRKCN